MSAGAPRDAFVGAAADLPRSAMVPAPAARPSLGRSARLIARASSPSGHGAEATPSAALGAAIDRALAGDLVDEPQVRGLIAMIQEFGCEPADLDQLRRMITNHETRFTAAAREVAKAFIPAQSPVVTTALLHALRAAVWTIYPIDESHVRMLVAIVKGAGNLPCDLDALTWTVRRNGHRFSAEGKRAALEFLERHRPGTILE